MDPLSILGATAAASQLFQQGLDISKFLWELYSRGQEAPEVIRRHIAEVDQLTELAKLIQQNPSLNHASIASVLDSCLSVTQPFQAMLQELSTSGQDGRFVRLQKAVLVVLKEKEIDRFFEQLERAKSSLIISIQRIDS